MIFAAGFTWWHLIGIGQDFKYADSLPEQLLGPNAEPHGYVHSLWSSWLMVLAVLAFAVLGRMALEAARRRDGVSKWYSAPGLGLLTLAELVIEFWQSMVGGNLSKSDARFFTPLVSGLFVYILLCNMLGMVPGFLPPTENVHHNWAMSLTVFVLFVGAGLLRDAPYFLKHLLGPVLALAPLILVIELVGLVVRPATLTIRLTGNLFGDHTVFTIMSDLVPWLVPVPFLGLALIVSFIQAFVFTLLTVIYIALSVPHEDSH